MADEIEYYLPASSSAVVRNAVLAGGTYGTSEGGNVIPTEGQVLPRSQRS